MNYSLKRIVAASLAIVLLLVPATAFAKYDGVEGGESQFGTAATASPSEAPKTTHEAANTTTTEQKELQQRVDALKTKVEDKIKDVKTELKVKLDDAHLKICQNHQTQVNNLMKAMDTRRQTAYDKITQVATSVEKFATDKNLTIDGYTSLVATVDSAKAAAQTAMQSQQQSPQLNCSNSQPRLDVTDFKTKRSDSISAMQIYRDAVKALVKAVKAAAETTKTGDTSNA